MKWGGEGVRMRKGHIWVKSWGMRSTVIFWEGGRAGGVGWVG